MAKIRKLIDQIKSEPLVIETRTVWAGVRKWVEAMRKDKEKSVIFKMMTFKGRERYSGWYDEDEIVSSIAMYIISEQSKKNKKLKK